MFPRSPARLAGRLAHIAPVLAAGALLAALAPPAVHAAIRFTGVNLAGAEFGSAGNGAALPGTYGSQYTYPTTAEIDYFVGKGMNTFRLPFRWERLQQSQNAAFNAAELNRMNTFVNNATAAGAHVILDPHNFARYYPNISDFGQMQSGSQGVIGSSGVPISSFADLWSRLADEYKDNDRVIFNLMNEPNAIDTQVWVDASNAAIEAIRDAGAKNLVLVPGISWTGAHSWVSSGNASAMLGIVDSGDNFAFDVHQYMDPSHCGCEGDQINNNDPMTGVQRVTQFTNWLKTNDRRGFLGEFAVANSRIGNGAADVGDELIVNLLDYMEANDDVWLGWAWWAGGPWWTSYMFSPEPTNLGSANPTDKPIMGVIQPYFADNFAGDFNFDGTVDAADYTIWRDSLGQTGAGLDADANIDGLIDDLDYAIWKDGFDGSLVGAGGTSAAVPEPSTMAFVVLSYLGCNCARRRPQR